MPYYDKKEYVTKKQIEADLRAAAKRLPSDTKATYQKKVIISIAVGIPLGIYAAINPRAGIIILLLFLAVVILSLIVEPLTCRYRQKKVRVDDYTVSRATVVDREREKYVIRSRGNSRTVIRCLVTFDNGETWLIPEENFVWSEEQRRSGPALYGEAEPGSTFWIVQKKSTGKIAVAYPTSLFTYREET